MQQPQINLHNHNVGDCPTCGYHDKWQCEDFEDAHNGKIKRRCLKCGKVLKVRYRKGKEAYCKYCYNTHNAWELSYAHGVEIVWTCLVCNYFTKDDFMQIERKGR